MSSLKTRDGSRAYREVGPYVAGHARFLGKSGFLIYLLLLAAVTFVFVHVVWPFTLPTPWIDESHFLIPAVSAYLHHDFTADQMLVHGIFWMPIHLYLLNGALFSSCGAYSLHLSRALSFALILTAALFLRLSVSALLSSDRLHSAIGNSVVLAWYICLPIVFCADLMRPDALSLCLSTATICAALRGRYVAALGTALACCATHPLEAFPAMAVALCILPLCFRARKMRWEWPVILFGAGLFCLDTGRDIANFGLYRLHMTMQISNKQGHHIPPYAFALPFLIVPTLIFFLTRISKAKNSALDVVSRRIMVLIYSLVCVFVTAYAQEMWYFIWEITGFVLLFVLAIELIQTAKFRVGTIGERISTLVMTKRMVVAWLVLLVGALTWAPGLRAKGIYGFFVTPERLSEITKDQAALQETISGYLRREQASHVLLSPSLFGLMATSDTDPNGIKFFTLNPFSTTRDAFFDHAVILTRGYPSATTDTITLPYIAKYPCRPPVHIGSPNGYYSVVVISFSSFDSSNKRIRSCSQVHLN